MDLGLLYQALSKRQVDMVAGNSTDGMLSVLPITVLEDDRHYFPPYECALVVREAAEKEFPALRPALLELSGRITSDTMRRLNYELDGKHRPARDIARNFLRLGGPALIAQRSISRDFLPKSGFSFACFSSSSNLRLSTLP